MKKFGLLIIILIAGNHWLDASEPDSALVFQQLTERSNALMNFTNYGTYGASFSSLTATNLWPRDSATNYLYSGGFAFVCKKRVNGEVRRMAEYTINPNTASDGHFSPGAIADGPLADYERPERFMAWSSLNHDSFSGVPIRIEALGQNWPLWHCDGDKSYLPGYYVYDELRRNPVEFPTGAAMISDEDIFCVYKDTDLARRDLPAEMLSERGYPLGLQVEQTAFTWSVEQYRDIIIILYKLINYSQDTLRGCWFAPLFDPDIAPERRTFMGYNDDRLAEDRTYAYEYQMAVCWSDTSALDRGMRFGYMGISPLMCPAVDSDGKLRNDKSFYQLEEQIPEGRLLAIPPELDIYNDSLFYEFLKNDEGTTRFGPGDVRFAMPLGPFDMAPGDTLKSAVLLAWAWPSFSDTPDDSRFNMVLMSNRIEAGYDLFYNSIITSIGGEETQTESIVIYPNPTGADLNIRINSPEAGFANLEIFDLKGRSAGISAKKYLNSGSNLINLDMGGLSSAAYILLIDINGRIHTELFTKIK
ncbi:MAG: T9SS type A sorting domain-containing protein [Candidatus Kapaibacterium sp.]